jgi:hypothetical protein
MLVSLSEEYIALYPRIQGKKKKKKKEKKNYTHVIYCLKII